MSWILRDEGFHSDHVTGYGNKYMTGNGYMGYRGTLEEFNKTQLVATTLAGVYDQVGNQWREPVNAPNGLATQVYCNGELLSVLTTPLKTHAQELDIYHAVHQRETIFQLQDNQSITYHAERFVSMDQLHLIASRMSLTCSKPCQLVIETGIDGDVWDINGPHFQKIEASLMDGTLIVNGTTQELQTKVAVAERIQFRRFVGNRGDDVAECKPQEEILYKDTGIFRRIVLDCLAGETIEWVKYVSIYTSLDENLDPSVAAIQTSVDAADKGYDLLRQQHELKWKHKWDAADIRIEGDDEAQFALRYSMYQLLLIAPTESGKVSIPARGLSGQVYKGAVFWDTEMFMLPFFLYTDPKVARNLMVYRTHTLEGAQRKAAEYGYTGAFYAWESQDSGDDACTLFNITDVFTGRPMRTYFREKQIHISADVVHGIWQYVQITGDTDFLKDGGAEVIWECARFFYSYSSYQPFKQRYELHDVTGPDEYHERVHNNAFTNYLVKESLSAALQTMDLLESEHRDTFEMLVSKHEHGPTIADIRRMNDELYVPHPDPDTGVINQFDRYDHLEDLSLSDLKSRMQHPHEYLGGGSGIATTTQIIKQADVVLLMHICKDLFPQSIKQANWQYYEPRTEHGSSLSHCVYALVASDIGMPDWAYPYFLRTATIDLTGDSKQYVGDLYIGGTHPAANGGAWMAAVLGFGGIHVGGQLVQIKPSLPSAWQALEFRIIVQGQGYLIRETHELICITADEANTQSITFKVGDTCISCPAGQTRKTSYTGISAHLIN